MQLGGALCLACMVTSAGELPAHLVARACQAPHRPLAGTPALPLILPAPRPFPLAPALTRRCTPTRSPTPSQALHRPLLGHCCVGAHAAMLDAAAALLKHSPLASALGLAPT